MSFNQKVQKIPLGLSGLCVGLGGLSGALTMLIQEAKYDWGNAAKNVELWTNFPKFILFSFVIVFFFLMVYRQIFVKKVFWNETKDPMLCSFMPTIAMTLMLISGFMASTYTMGTSTLPTVNAVTIIASILWYCAIIIHLFFAIMFTIHILMKHNFKNDNVYASWFVPPIGIIVSCTVAGAFPTEIIPNELFLAIWFLGFSLYLVFLPYVLYKIVFADNIHHDRIPTLAIFGAPANLSLAGFLSIKDAEKLLTPSVFWVFVIILSILAISTTLFLYVCFAKIFKTRFNPTYASLTFPTAIGATSMLLLSSKLHEQNKLLSGTFNVIGYIELIVATCINMYVLARFLYILWKCFFTKEEVIVDNQKTKVNMKKKRK